MVASIQYIEQIIATFSEAAQANLSTPGREGNTVVLDTQRASEVMVTGDIHGNRRNFNAIRKTAELDQRPGRHLVLQEVCHGGPQYPNGGCMSHLILEDVAKLKVQFPERVHFILGNHELAELTDYPIQKNRQMLNLMFRLGLQQMYGPATEKVRQAYSEFIRTCPLAIRLPGGVFISHSVPEYADAGRFDKSIFRRRIEPSEFYERTGVFELVWGRDYRPENAAAFAKLVGATVLVNGHEPCPAGYSTPNPTQIILDCCGERACYAILATDRQWTQNEIVERIERLP
ncbi:MAG: metallophosphoesterase [Pirellulales bacterium]|nr:metallophosphoesterase [Pirellulales bacterium]